MALLWRTGDNNQSKCQAIEVASICLGQILRGKLSQIVAELFAITQALVQCNVTYQSISIVSLLSCFERKWAHSVSMSPTISLVFQQTSIPPANVLNMSRYFSSLFASLSLKNITFGAYMSLIKERRACICKQTTQNKGIYILFLRKRKKHFRFIDSLKSLRFDIRSYPAQFAAAL